MNSRMWPMRVLRWHHEISDILCGEKRGPIRLQIDLTNLCNHRCPWCEPVKYREATIRTRAHTLETETVFQILDDAKQLGTHTLIFSGGGEPLLHPDFGAILQRARGMGFQIALNTNGALLDKWMEVLWCAHVVRISLDAINAEQHAIQHGKPGEFDKICASIKKLCSQSPRPEVGLAFVVSECNDGSDFDALRRKLGADFMQVRDERGARDKEPRDFKRCYSALMGAVIGANGDVQACCDRRDIVFGNVYKKRFSDLWLSDIHRGIASEIIPSFCQKCVQAHFNSGVERFIVQDEARSWIV